MSESDYLELFVWAIFLLAPLGFAVWWAWQVTYRGWHCGKCGRAMEYSFVKGARSSGHFYCRSCGHGEAA